MNRFEALTGWFFTLLGILLFGWSVLIVPERAFAAMTTYSCTEACCDAYCGDPYCDFECSFEVATCITDCETCKALCEYAADPPTCEAICITQAGKLTNCFAKACQDEETGCHKDCGGQFCSKSPVLTCFATAKAGCICPY